VPDDDLNDRSKDVEISKIHINIRFRLHPKIARSILLLTVVTIRQEAEHEDDVGVVV
jgi:hypothetical protein